MTKSRAAWLVARYLAKFVTAGQMDACKWCEEMGDYSWSYRDEPEGDDLSKLHGLALSYEEYVDSRMKTLREMHEEARAFATRTGPGESR
ncbi:MAG TPA: hypothetical protein VJU16_08450, partial [Planctomycetota bacterium]|nr:hypothetical protein [Planctomycetota bacterium]